LTLDLNAVKTPGPEVAANLLARPGETTPIRIFPRLRASLNNRQAPAAR